MNVLIKQALTSSLKFVNRQHQALLDMPPKSVRSLMGGVVWFVLWGSLLFFVADAFGYGVYANTLTALYLIKSFLAPIRNATPLANEPLRHAQGRYSEIRIWLNKWNNDRVLRIARWCKKRIALLYLGATVLIAGLVTLERLGAVIGLCVMGGVLQAMAHNLYYRIKLTELVRAYRPVDKDAYVALFAGLPDSGVLEKDALEAWLTTEQAAIDDNASEARKKELT